MCVVGGSREAGGTHAHRSAYVLLARTCHHVVVVLGAPVEARQACCALHCQRAKVGRVVHQDDSWLVGKRQDAPHQPLVR